MRRITALFTAILMLGCLVVPCFVLAETDGTSEHPEIMAETSTNREDIYISSNEDGDGLTEVILFELLTEGNDTCLDTEEANGDTQVLEWVPQGEENSATETEEANEDTRVLENVPQDEENGIAGDNSDDLPAEEQQTEEQQTEEQQTDERQTEEQKTDYPEESEKELAVEENGTQEITSGTLQNNSTVHTVSDVSLTQVNGYTTLTFLVDGRFRGVISGLDPDTTLEEAESIAQGAAVGLDGEQTFSVSDAEIYNGYEDPYGIRYEAFFQTLDGYYAIVNNPASTAADIKSAGYTLRSSALSLINAAGDSELRTLYDAYYADPGDDAKLEAFLLGVEAFNTKHTEDRTAERTYTDPNAVFTGQTSLIDAEKNSLNGTYFDADEKDTRICWAASAANMLWYSGWGAQALNPDTGEYFTSEDELFAWFTQCFTDDGSMQYDGLRYLFEGTNARQTKSQGAKLFDDYASAEEPYALLKDYCLSLIADSVTLGNDITVLNSKLAAIEQGSALGVGVYTKYITGGHALTVYGTVEDLFATDEENRFIGLFLADSDNDVPNLSKTQYDTELAEEGLKDPSQRRNSYTLSLTKPWTDALGTYTTLDLVNYGGKVILYTCTLDAYTEETAASALETDPDATKNARDTADLKPLSLISTDGASLTVAKESYQQGENVYAVLRVNNDASTAVRAGTCPSYEVTLYSVNEKTGKTTALKTVSGSYAGSIGAYKTVSASEFVADDLPAGTYLLKLTGLNDDHALSEAYYVNNLTVDGFTFTVIGKASPRQENATHDATHCYTYAYWTAASTGTLSVELCAEHTVSGMQLYLNGNPVDSSAWEIQYDANTAKPLLRLDAAYLNTLPLGETVFTLELGDCVLFVSVTVESLLG